MENRIKECQLGLYADRTSAATMRANQLRRWFASMAHILLCAFRRIALAETRFTDATCGTIRLKLLKIGALVRISVRRIKFAMASACPAAIGAGRLPGEDGVTTSNIGHAVGSAGTAPTHRSRRRSSRRPGA